MKDFLLGWAIISTLVNVYTIWLLYKKQTTTNQIDNLKQKNKHNKQSNIDNDISSSFDLNNAQEERKERKKRKIFRILTKKEK